MANAGNVSLKILRDFQFFLLLVSLLFSSKLRADNFAQLKELGLKKNTLLYLRNSRSAELLNKLIKDLPAESRKTLKSNITGPGGQVLLANFDEKAAELTRLLADEARNSAEKRAELLAKTQKVNFPHNRIFYQLLRQIYANLLMDSKPDSSVRAKKVKNMMARIKARPKKDAYSAMKAHYAKTKLFDFPIWWYDSENYGVAYETGDKDARDLNRKTKDRLNLNKASAEELIAIPGIGATLAKRIIKARPFHAVSGLSVVEGISASKYNQIQDFFYVPLTKQKKKKWTVMLYFAGDNDLELCELGDVNEMEKVGSNKDVNLVLQLDRSKSHTVSDGNWAGARRYYITKDFDPKKVTSPIKEELGAIDMGKKESLENFGTFCIKNYPAERYLLVIGTHGAGWPGIAPEDDRKGTRLNIMDLAGAVNNIAATLLAEQGKRKLDIVDFDACLMGMVEVAYELRDSVEVLVASQEVSPGYGMPYSDYLPIINKKPDLHPETIAKYMVQAYVRSYAKGGSQTSTYFESYNYITKSAIRLCKISSWVQEWDKLARLLKQQNDNTGYFGKLIATLKLKRYEDDTYADAIDFLFKLKDSPVMNREIKEQVERILKLYSHPRQGDDPIDRPVIITSKKPGYVIWGLNGWKRPPEELFPAQTDIYRTRFARTRLTGPMRDGNYVA
ncbi:clostripain-related cysteine peptidase, partial [Candidatus Riflebacteria bacterium]